MEKNKEVLINHKEFSRRGGQVSSSKRLDGKTKEEISEHMKKVRAGEKLRIKKAVAKSYETK